MRKQKASRVILIVVIAILAIGFGTFAVLSTTNLFDEQVPEELTVGTFETCAIPVSGGPDSEYEVTTDVGSISRSSAVKEPTSIGELKGRKDGATNLQEEIYPVDEDGRVVFNLYADNGATAGQTAKLDIKRVGGSIEKSYQVKIISATAASDAIASVTGVKLKISEQPKLKDGTPIENTWAFGFVFVDAQGNEVNVARGGNKVRYQMNYTGARFTCALAPGDATEIFLGIVGGYMPYIEICDLPADLQKHPVHLTVTLCDVDTPTGITRTVNVGDSPDVGVK